MVQQVKTPCQARDPISIPHAGPTPGAVLWLHTLACIEQTVNIKNEKSTVCHQELKTSEKEANGEFRPKDRVGPAFLLYSGIMGRAVNYWRDFRLVQG